MIPFYRNLLSLQVDDPKFNALNPEVVVISNGTRRDYRHPRWVTVERLQAHTSVVDIYQTNKNTVEAEFTDILNVPDGFIGDLDSVGAEGTIRLEVTGGQYTVTLMDRGITNTYPIQFP